MISYIDIAFFAMAVIMVIAGIKKGDIIKIKNMDDKEFEVLGGAFGFVKALILVCVFSAIIGAAEQYIPKDSAFSEMVGSSYAIDFINDINPFN